MDKKKRNESEPTVSVDGQLPTRETTRRRRLSKLLLPIFMVALTAFTAYNTLQVTGALNAHFPNSETFSIGVAYSFANSQGSVLLPGSTGNVTLTIISAVSKPVTLNLSFNSTSPAEWAYAGLLTGGSNPVCYPPTAGDLTMNLAGVNILPVNTPLVAPANCQNSGSPGPGYATSSPVTVNTGQNTFTGTITVSTSATISTFVTINWFANQ